MKKLFTLLFVTLITCNTLMPKYHLEEGDYPTTPEDMQLWNVRVKRLSMPQRKILAKLIEGYADSFESNNDLYAKAESAVYNAIDIADDSLELSIDKDLENGLDYTTAVNNANKLYRSYANVAKELAG